METTINTATWRKQSVGTDVRADWIGETKQEKTMNDRVIALYTRTYQNSPDIRGGTRLGFSSSNPNPDPEYGETATHVLVLNDGVGFWYDPETGTPIIILDDMTFFANEVFGRNTWSLEDRRIGTIRPINDDDTPTFPPDQTRF